MKSYVVTGEDRRQGAIGTFSQWTLVVEAEDIESARELARSKRYEMGMEHVAVRHVVERAKGR